MKIHQHVPLIGRLVAGLSEPDEARAQRLVCTSMMALGAPQLFVWAGIYGLFGHELSAALLGGFGVITFVAVAVSAQWPKGFRPAFRVVLCLLLTVNTTVSFLEGGLTRSHGQFVWAFVAPLTAIMVFGRRSALVCASTYVAAVVGLALYDRPPVEQPPLPQTISAFLAAANIIAVSVLMGTGLGLLTDKKTYLLERLREEEARNEELLRNILPEEVAAELKSRGAATPRTYPEATIVFLDLVGFTRIATGQTPEETVLMLNRLYSEMDRMVVEFGLEKIKTIGDCYMVASGIPTERDDHAEAAVRLAHALADRFDQRPPGWPEGLSYRVGVHSGPVTAGVIGSRKFSYDVWGDTVNVASRMESHGEPGRIHISDSTYRRITHVFECEARGPLNIKGKGPMETWFVLGPRSGVEQECEAMAGSL